MLAPGETLMPAKVIVTASAAGSLDPLRRILSELPGDLDAAILIAQHRAAPSGLLFAKMLRKVTALKVHSLEGHLALTPSAVYVLPPDGDPFVSVDAIDIGKARGPGRRRSALDATVRSATASYGPDVIGLEVAGGNLWSSENVQAIHDAGGVVVAQQMPAAQRPRRHDPDPGFVLTAPLGDVSFLLMQLVQAGPLRHLLTAVS